MRIPGTSGGFPDDAFADARRDAVVRGGQILTDGNPQQGEYSHRWSAFLPSGNAVLFTVDTGGSFDNASVGVLSFDTGAKKDLFPGGTNPVYSPTGHIVFAQGGSLYAVPFDVETLEVTGPRVLILEGVLMEPGGAAHFALSQEGSLVYVPGDKLVPSRRLVWVNRDSDVEPLSVPLREYSNPSVSPDGHRGAVTIRDGSNYDIWIADARRGTLAPLTTHPGEDFVPIWTPDGARVTFASEMGGPVGHTGPGGPSPWWRSENRTGDAEPIQIASDELAGKFPTSWSPDGQTLVFSAVTSERENGIWIQSLDSGAEAQRFQATEFNEYGAMFSPDGEWLAFSSNESGRFEVYVKRFDGSGGVGIVSVDGGTEPVWSRDGREIFYRDGYKMMAVPIRTGPELDIGTPEMLFEGRFLPTGRPDARRNYDVGSDGRFLMIQREEDLAPTEIRVRLNFFEELRRLAPPSQSQ